MVRRASLDLHWFSPRDARRFVEAARALGLLAPEEGGGRVRPTFDIQSVEVPLDFRIGPQALDALGAPAGAGVVEELAAAAARARGVPLDRVWGEIRSKESAKGIAASVAALLVAAEAGIEVKPFVSKVREELRRL